MHATESRAGDLHETVRSVLAQKGHALWSISPDVSVFDAIESMSEKHIGALVVLSAGTWPESSRNATMPARSSLRADSPAKHESARS